MNHKRIAILITSVWVAAMCCSPRASAQTPPYNLGSLPAGFTVQWPTPPTITRSVDVSTQAEFNKAASVAGTLITVKAVISGRGTISASDIEVHMTDGASLGGLFINKALKRIAVYGGHYTDWVEISLPSVFWPSRVDDPAWVVEDVMFDGVSVRSPTRTAFFLRGHRVALLRSFAYAADYALYSDTIAQDKTSDMILAGNNLQAEGQQATVRVRDVRNFVAVDNRLTDWLLTGSSKHNFRVHGVSDQVFAARNELVNAGTMLGTGPGDDIGHLWFDANTFHHKTPDLFNLSKTQLHVLHAHDNVAYTNVWKCFYCSTPLATWDLANNVIAPYVDPPPPPPGMPVQ